MTNDHTCERCGQPVEIMSIDKDTSYYRGTCIERIEELARQLHEARDILEWLVDLQTDGPNPRQHPQWDVVMARAYRVLGRPDWKAQG